MRDFLYTSDAEREASEPSSSLTNELAATVSGIIQMLMRDPAIFWLGTFLRAVTRQLDLNFHRTSISRGARPLLFKPDGFKLRSSILGFSGGIGGWRGSIVKPGRAVAPIPTPRLLLFPWMIVVDSFRYLEENKTRGTKASL